MADEDEAARQAHARGRAAGLAMGDEIVLQVLLRHVIAASADPEETGRKLRDAADDFARSLSDGSGVDGPEILGARAGALERVDEIFTPARPPARQ